MHKRKSSKSTKKFASKIKSRKSNYFVTSLLAIGIISIFTALYYLIPKKQSTEIFVVGSESGTVDLTITPSTVQTLPNVVSTFTISIDAGLSHATSAEVEIDYDSDKIGIPIITKGDYFPVVVTEATTDNNKIKFTFSTEDATDSAKTGAGILATIKINPTVVGTSTLSFTENTQISTTESQTNSLKTVTNAAVTITSASADPSAPASTAPTSSPAPQKPAKPTGLRSNCYDGGTKITLRWDSVAGASSYKVRMDQKDGNSDISVDNITKNEYEAGIKPDQKYSWWVHSSKNGVDSEEAKINEVVCAKPASSPTPTPTATPKAAMKATAKATPKPTSTPKSNATTTPKPFSINTNSVTPSPSAIGSLNDIFGEKPEEDVSNSSIETGLFAKIALGWQAIFLKLVELFK